MKVFADTSYWIAAFDLEDQWHSATIQTVEALTDAHLVTTQEVLTEFLNYFSGSGSQVRKEAVGVVRDALGNSDVTVLLQSKQSFLDGLSRYADRLDKGYSLTDCISMVAMEREGIEQVLTSDRHFAQEGFQILLS